MAMTASADPGRHRRSDADFFVPNDAAFPDTRLVDIEADDRAARARKGGATGKLT
jgi:hypothetical protein